MSSEKSKVQANKELKKFSHPISRKWKCIALASPYPTTATLIPPWLVYIYKCFYAFYNEDIYYV